MYEGTLSDQPGVELDAEVSWRLLQEGDKYSDHVDALAHFILARKASFRAALQRTNTIQTVDPPGNPFELAAVDGASNVVPHGGGSIITAAAYKSTLNDPKQRGDIRVISIPNNEDSDAFATLLRVHLELSLLASDKLDEDNLVVLDHSFWGLLQAVSRGLAAYKKQAIPIIERGENPNKDAMLGQWLLLFKSCLGRGGSFIRMVRNKRIIALPKTGISQHFTNLLIIGEDVSSSTIGSNLNDRVLLRHVLHPGEYTTPFSVFEGEREKEGNKKGQLVTGFKDNEGPDPYEVRNQVYAEYGMNADALSEVPKQRLLVTYYRPHEWSRVYRIEFHEVMLSNKNGTSDALGRGERFQRVLESVYRSTNRETMEPICQVLADIRAKAAAACAADVLPERTFYQMQATYRGNPEMLDIIQTIIAEERT